MNNEKLNRGNELVEIIKEIEQILDVFPLKSEDNYRCQIKITYNVPYSTIVNSATISADRIPAAFKNLQAMVKEELVNYEKEFDEL